MEKALKSDVVVGLERVELRLERVVEREVVFKGVEIEGEDGEGGVGVFVACVETESHGSPELIEADRVLLLLEDLLLSFEVFFCFLLFELFSLFLGLILSFDILLFFLKIELILLLSKYSLRLEYQFIVIEFHLCYASVFSLLLNQLISLTDLERSIRKLLLPIVRIDDHLVTVIFSWSDLFFFHLVLELSFVEFIFKLGSHVIREEELYFHSGSSFILIVFWIIFEYDFH